MVMLGPRYVETSPMLTRERNRERNFHLKHLQAISSRVSRPLPRPTSPQSHPTPPFLPFSRQDDIRRENKALFTRLLSISRSRNRALFVPHLSVHRSLNYFSRKRENQKIEEENSRIAERILSQAGYPSAKQLHQAYQHSQRYRSQLTRMRAGRRPSKPRVYFI